MGISTTYARLVFIRQKDDSHDKRNVPVFYFVIRSIFSRSSCVNVIFASMPMLSKIWDDLDAPIRTLVISLSRRIHASAISANV